MEITKKSAHALLKAIGDKLDTADKRKSFLKKVFPELLPKIKINGSIKSCALDIYHTFRSNKMLGSLMAHMNSDLGCNLYLELKENKKKRYYYQPEFDDRGDVKGHPGEYIWSFEVYRKKSNLMKDYPKCNPLAYEYGDIEKPLFVD